MYMSWRHLYAETFTQVFNLFVCGACLVGSWPYRRFLSLCPPLTPFFPLFEPSALPRVGQATRCER